MKGLISKVNLVLVILSLSLTTEAQRMKSTVVELRNRFENQITHNIQGLIATQLTPGSFDVSTRVKVVEVPPPADKPDPKKPEPEQMPAGMDLGAIDVREVIKSYIQEIDELKAFKENTKMKPEPEPTYSVTQIDVVVGLSDLYEDAYVQQFQTWLAKRVQYDYGGIAKASVNKTKPMPVKPEEPKKEEPPKELTWKDYVIPNLPYLILFLGALIAAWLLMRGLSRLGTGTKKFVMEYENQFSLLHNQSVETKNQDNVELTKKDSEKDDDKRLVASLEGADFIEEDLKEEDEQVAKLNEELVGKITYLCLDLKSGVSDLVRIWMDKGSDGFLKVAVLLDMIVTLKEKVTAETAVANLQEKGLYNNITSEAILGLEIPMDNNLASVYGVNLSEAYREASAMNVTAKTKYLEKIYWDLLQVKTLGIQNMRKPFDYLQAMSDIDYAEVLNSQTEETRALALMFGDQQKARVYMSSIALDMKEKIVEKMVLSSHVPKKQIWMTDSKIKSSYIRNFMSDGEGVVNLLPRTIDMLNSLSPVDEIKTLRGVIESLPDKGVSIKQQHITLAFIDEWHEEYIVKLLKVAKTNELVELIKMVPEAEDLILRNCPETMKMIIADDIKMKSPDNQTVYKLIKQLKTRWKAIVTTENISMNDVINFEYRQGWNQSAA